MRLSKGILISSCNCRFLQRLPDTATISLYLIKNHQKLLEYYKNVESHDSLLLLVIENWFHHTYIHHTYKLGIYRLYLGYPSNRFWSKTAQSSQKWKFLTGIFRPLSENAWIFRIFLSSEIILQFVEPKAIFNPIRYWPEHYYTSSFPHRIRHQCSLSHHSSNSPWKKIWPRYGYLVKNMVFTITPIWLKVDQRFRSPKKSYNYGRLLHPSPRHQTSFGHQIRPYIGNRWLWIPTMNSLRDQNGSPIWNLWP